ncbi:hypothetical protein [Thermus igniterrae]|jgi:hypothetical protein|uniref:hypothetical protein n=1 Tax=Thermus igniterrae TaxID=88189 RepID=UPI0003794BEC|nr:hypothetical protein [Thermus igniterrae]
MGLEKRVERLLELDPKALDPRTAEALMDEVLAVFRRHLPVRALEARLERREGHLLLLAVLEEALDPQETA